MDSPRQVLLCVPAARQWQDPDPALTSARSVQLVQAPASAPAAVVGWSTGGWDALCFAAALSAGVERLVLVAVPYPGDEWEWPDPMAVTAKTLLLFGDADEATGSKHARLWKKRLPSARLEMVPRGGHELLRPMWPRILAHVAPRTTR